ncbi:MAG: NAD(P)-binding domain-containing protein [Candidatus Acidiferrales bacterium]
MTTGCDVVVLGAGPYGLAAGAHLRNIQGLEVRVFGEPMEFWKSHMPEGMLLRSPWAASHISDPGTGLTMDAYRDELGTQIPTPIPLDRFVEYGLWFQRQAVPQVDRRKIARVETNTNAFLVTLSDGEQFHSRRVVVAAGIGSFARRPKEFEGQPSELVTHVSDGRDLRCFAGKRVAVIGAGQSALESAALIHENGGEVEVIVRAPDVHWLGWRARLQKLGPIAKLLYSPFDIGPAGISRIVAVPDAVKYFPRRTQDAFRRRALRPAGARWLFGRFKDIPISKSRFVQSAQQFGDKLRLRLNDGTAREVDHVLLGTGYRVDVTRYPFLAPELSRSLAQVNGFPRLAPGFESSVRGLHFLGAPSSWNFGPLMFFVCGTDYAARRLARYVSASRSRNGSR